MSDELLTARDALVQSLNAPAVHLYKDMGFTIDHTDRAYTADIAPA